MRTIRIQEVEKTVFHEAIDLESKSWLLLLEDEAIEIHLPSATRAQMVEFYKVGITKIIPSSHWLTCYIIVATKSSRHQFCTHWNRRSLRPEERLIVEQQIKLEIAAAEIALCDMTAEDESKPMLKQVPELTHNGKGTSAEDSKASLFTGSGTPPLDTKLKKGTDAHREQEKEERIVLGRFKYMPGFNEVWLDDEFFDLRARNKARFCIEFLVKEKAFDKASARDFISEIDVYVRTMAGIERKSVDVRLHHYFGDRKSTDKRLEKLRKALIRPVGRNGRYYLKTN